MKALIVSVEGRQAVVLLEGGEMRTVHARNEWKVGQEIPAEEIAGAAAPSEKVRPMLYAMAAVAAMIMLWFGTRGLGNVPIDQTDYQPLSSGGVGEYVVPSAAPDEAEVLETIPPEPTADSVLIVEPTREIFPESTARHGCVHDDDDEDDEDDDEDDDDDDEDDEDDEDDDEDDDDDDD